MNAKSVYSTCLGALACVFMAGCGNNANTSLVPTNKPAYKVAVLKLGSHALIDEVEKAVFRSLKDRYGNAVSISVYNADFQEDMLRQSVDQIVSSNFDVTVPITTKASSALINSIKKNQQVVFSFVSNPESLWGEGRTKPDNVTGTSDQIDYENNLRLIATLLPAARRIGYLVNESEAQAKLGLEEVRQRAVRCGFSIIPGSVSSPGDVAVAARSLIDKVDVFLVGGDNTVVSGLGGLLSVADKASKLVFAVERTSVEKGCIAAYGIDYTDLGTKTADLVIAALEMGKVASQPVVYFKETKLYVNRQVFEKAGLSIPSNAGRIY